MAPDGIEEFINVAKLVKLDAVVEGRFVFFEFNRNTRRRGRSIAQLTRTRLEWRLDDTTQPRGTVFVQFLGRQEIHSTRTHRSEFPSHFPWEASGTSVRSRVAAHWSSWADCIKMVRN